MQNIKFFILSLLFGCMALSAEASDLSGLYYAPETKHAIYVDWDLAGRHAKAVYMSEQGRPYKRFEIMTQDTKSHSNYAFSYYIQIWETSNPNISYELNFGIEVIGDEPLLYMNFKRSQERIRLARLGDSYKVPFPDKNTLNYSLTEAFSNINWWYFDPEDGQVHADVKITAMVDAYDPSHLNFTLEDSEMTVGVQCAINSNMLIKIDMPGYENFGARGDIELGNDVQWQIHCYAPSGELLFILMQSM